MRGGLPHAGYVDCVTGDDSDKPTPQPAWLIAVPIALVAAAIALVGYGWLHRTPTLGLADDHSVLTSLLWRTTWVVAGSALLVVLYFAIGRVYRRTVDRRAMFVGHTGLALVVLAVAAYLAMSRGGTKAAFKNAEDAQLALDPLAITTLTKSAWLLACLAVAALAVMCFVGYFVGPPEEPRKRNLTRVLVPVFAVVLAVAMVVPVVVSAKASPFHNELASPAEHPLPSGIAGEVAFRAELKPIASYARPGGAGFVHVGEGPSYTDSHRVEGFDGVTGERRWSFTVPRFNVSELRTTGSGPGSVALIKAYTPTDSMMGLDATTGELLWARTDYKAFDEDYPLSASVMLMGPERFDESGRRDPDTRQWQAVSPKTGETLWTKTFDVDCGVSVEALDTAVLMRTCDDPGDVVARVLDPQSGEERSTITDASLGVNPVDADRRWTTDPRFTAGDRVLLGRTVYDVAAGKVIATVPVGSNASFIDADSMLLEGPQPSRDEPAPVSILDLRDGRVIPTGLFLTWRANEEVWLPITRAGDQWVSLLPDTESRPRFLPGAEKSTAPLPLHVISDAGEVTTLKAPCPGVDAAPLASAIPGSVLVLCSPETVAAVR